MLELRLTADVKRIAAMREALARECERSQVGPQHAAEVTLVVEQLVGPPEARGAMRSRLRTRASGDVFLVVTVQSDATMLMVRDTRPENGGLGEHRQRLLEEHTSSWSTMSGRDGRTVWAEIARPVAAPAPRREETRPARPSEVAADPGRRQPIATSPRRTAPRVPTRA